MNRYLLAADSFGEEEKQAVQMVMESGRYTMGEKVREFEKAFASWIGGKHALMVNSGSSANLLLIASLLYRTNGRAQLKPGDEVLVPALSWPTTVWPISQLGLVPVFVDIDPQTLAISVESARKALTPKTKAMFLIHVLGQSADMDAITQFCNENKIVLVEDCCESLGTFHQGRHVGLFGIGGTYSHFFSHHLTTMEGGTIVTDDDELIEDLRSLRAHGWTRDRSDQKQIHEQFSHLDPRFLFLLPGFNVRPMELQAAVGLVQLKKLDGFMEQREQIAARVQSVIGSCPWLHLVGQNWLPKSQNWQRKERRHSWMNLPFILDESAPLSCQQAKDLLEKAGVETRPIIAGNLTKHPALSHIECRVADSLEVSDRLLQNGFMIGCNPQATGEEMQTLLGAMETLVAQ